MILLFPTLIRFESEEARKKFEVRLVKLTMNMFKHIRFDISSSD